MIDILFALLNFGIIVFLIGYLFKKSTPKIKSVLEAEIDFEKDLHTEHHQLLVSQQHLDESIIRQEEQCAQLSVKVNEWKAAMERVSQEREAEKLFHEKELEKRISIQSDNYRLQKMYETLSPLVIAELESTLTAYFQDEKRAHAYIDRCIEGLKK